MEKRGLTELATWLAGMLIVATVLVICIFKGCDTGGLMSTFIGLSTAFGVRAIKGAVDRGAVIERKTEEPAK